MSRRTFLEYPVDDYTHDEILRLIDTFVLSRTPHQVVVLNANKMYLMNKHPRLKEVMYGAALILPENAIYFGSKWMGKPLRARDLGGLPLMYQLLEQSTVNSYRYYFLGSTEEAVSALVRVCRARYPGLRMAGFHHGFLDRAKSAEVVAAIRSCEPDILFVAMGSPQQELWIAENLEALNVPVCVGVGGSFEVLAGMKKVAPRWTKYGLEWVYRSLQDPRKFPHYLVVNGYFLYKFGYHFLFDGVKK
jgi:N-acetylglucosaminyldiphosphoundecaprenol N-acetyl-beta-D-mannosaminyltransferase